MNRGKAQVVGRDPKEKRVQNRMEKYQVMASNLVQDCFYTTGKIAVPNKEQWFSKSFDVTGKIFLDQVRNGNCNGKCTNNVVNLQLNQSNFKGLDLRDSKVSACVKYATNREGSAVLALTSRHSKWVKISDPCTLKYFTYSSLR